VNIQGARGAVTRIPGATGQQAEIQPLMLEWTFFNRIRFNNQI
jgi:hypothetical protein